MGTLGTNKNFKIGDEVEILPLTRHEKMNIQLDGTGKWIPILAQQVQ